MWHGPVAGDVDAEDGHEHGGRRSAQGEGFGSRAGVHS